MKWLWGTTIVLINYSNSDQGDGAGADNKDIWWWNEETQSIQRKKYGILRK